MSKEKKFDFIIVGGGITGLEMAALLSHDGYRTLVLEKTGRVGGRAWIWKKDGFTVDYGIHAVRFGPTSALSQICNHLGHTIEYYPQGTCWLIDEDGKKKRFPTGAGALLATKLFGFWGRFRALRFLLKTKYGSFEKLYGVSVQDWLDEQGFKGGMRRYLRSVTEAMMVSSQLDRISVGSMLDNVSRVLRTGYSALYPKGGWVPLFDLFETTIEKGGEIHSDTPVDAIEIENGRAIGVRCGEEVIEAVNVISCVPVQQIFDGLLDSSLFPAETVKRCRSQRPTAGISLDYGLKKRIVEEPGYWFMYEPSSHGSFISNFESSLAPPDKQLLTWIYPCSVEDMEDSATAKVREEEVEQALFDRFVGLEENIEWRRALRLKMVNGAEVNVDQHPGKRVGPRIDGVENLYLIGDSTDALGVGGDIGQESVVACYELVSGNKL